MEPPIGNEDLSRALKEFEANYNKKQQEKTPPVPPIASQPSQTPPVPLTQPSFQAPQATQELSSALKEFETKYVSEQQKKATQAPLASFSDTPKMVRAVIKYSGGLIKNQRQAEYLLFGLFIIMMGISFYLFFGGSIGTNTRIPPASMNPPGMVGFPQSPP